MFKNEATNLPNCLKSLSGVVDFIVGYNDSSSDESGAVFKSFGGVVIGEGSNLKHVNGEEKDIRSLLLHEGRKLGATHFLCIDADELLSDTLKKDFRSHCSKLSIGQKMNIYWVNLTNNGKSYFAAQSPFKPTLKDFVVRDCPDLAYQRSGWEMHFDRTPSSKSSGTALILSEEEGAVLHLQHLDEEAYKTKQAKYKCIELIKSSQTAYQINDNTSFTQSDRGEIRELPGFFTAKELIIAQNDLARSEVLKEVQDLFELHGITHFEKLDIWTVKALHEIFKKETGRKPRKFIFMRFLRRVKLKIARTYREFWVR